MKYYAHTPSDIREMLGEDLDFEILSEQGEWPAEILFANEEDAKTAYENGLVTK